MIEKAKIMRPRPVIEAPSMLPAEDSVLDIIAPTSRMIICRRSGTLVSSSHCTYVCDIHNQEPTPFDSEGGAVCCIFAYDDILGHLGGAALSES